MRFPRTYFVQTCRSIQQLVFTQLSARMMSLTTENVVLDLKPPPAVRHMQKLDKSLFRRIIHVPYLTVEPCNVSRIMRNLKKYLLKLQHFRPVREEDNLTTVFLNPLQVKTYTDLHVEDRQALEGNGVYQEHFSSKQLELNFENYSADDIFSAVLPLDKDGMASFTKVGHIVHVNLRDHLLPFKTLIGEVLLDKVAACKTVVNKTNIIDNAYRNFKMEVLTGEEDFMVTVKENRCIFEFDFAEVYWNSRLCTEHERIAQMIHKNDVLFDVFSGVGPFAIPAGKKGARVWANDLNPESFKWLQHNASKNKIEDNLTMCNKDGKDFILDDIRRELVQALKEERNVYITMNLPALASDFLKYFEGLYDEKQLSEIPDFKAPTVYLYCFAKGEEPNEITRKLINNCMNRDMSMFVKELFKVRTVSNFKEMMRVKISLEKEILSGKYIGSAVGKRKSENDIIEEAITKKFHEYGQEEQDNKECP